MIITYWTPFSGSGNTTLALTTALVMSRKKSGRKSFTIFPTAINDNTMMEYTLGEITDESKPLCGGIDNALNTVNAGNLELDKINNNAFNPGRADAANVHILSATESKIPSSHYNLLQQSLVKAVTETGKSRGSSSIVDLDNYSQPLIYDILSISDFIVVTIPQNKFKLIKFVEDCDFPKSITSKFIYVVNNYDSRCNLQVNSISSILGKITPKAKVITINNTVEVKNACMTGSIKSLIYKHTSTKSIPNKEVKDFVTKIESIIGHFGKGSSV